LTSAIDAIGYDAIGSASPKTGVIHLSREKKQRSMRRDGYVRWQWQPDQPRRRDGQLVKFNYPTYLAIQTATRPSSVTRPIARGGAR
jgi:hypothetical protein